MDEDVRITNFVIYGAGGIGGVIGARLAQAGHNVSLIARGEHGQKMRQLGLRLIAPDQSTTLQLPVFEHPREIQFDAQSVVLMCMKSQHMESALVDLSRVADAQIAIACVQNGVANERTALRYFARVYATVVNLPAMFINPGEVITHAAGHGGILDTGCYPRGVDQRAIDITEALSDAGFSARPDPTVMRFKYAKLLMNLGNVLQAILADAGAAGEIGRQARKEALACIAAADIDCASRDEVAARRENIYRMVDIPGHPRTAGSSWQSLARGNNDIETEYLNGEVCLLGRLHGVATPVNDACVLAARELVARKLGPGAFTASALVERIEQLERAQQ